MTTPEAIACREALALAEDLLLHDFVVATDSKEVAADIHKGSKGMYGQVRAEIKLRPSEFNCTFHFEGRASNNEVHLLAKFSHSLNRVFE